MQRYLRSSALLAAFVLILAACQPSDGGASPAASEPAQSEPAATTAGEDPAAVCAADEFGCVEIPAGEPLHIAYWGVLSGGDATLGTDSMRGVEIAVDDIGGSLLDHEILLTTEDALCTPEGGATAAQRLAADSTIVGLIGSSCSDETVGGIQTLTEAGLTTISPSNTRPALTAEDRGEEYAGYMRTAHSDAFQGKAVAEYAFNELGVTTAATIHDGSAYAEALQQVFVDEFTALGGEVLIQEAVAKEQTDMVPVLTRVAAESPEFLYYPIFVAEGGFITAQVRGVAGLEDVELMGSDGMFSPDFVTAAGPNAVGMHLSSPDFTAFGDAYADFLAAHEEKYGENVLSIFHAHAYDAANMLFAALEDVALTDADGTLFVPKGGLRARLFETSEFQGMTGTLSCSPTGDCGAPVIAVYEITEEHVSDPTTWPPAAPIWP
ncbi:MAG: branched-chain amino acid ABC transporter substrate-binding protein [Candidatus Limnocylindria bacterium]